MRAMILAAGRGERMRPLTDDVPKPLLQVGNKALIEFHIEALVKAGVHEIVINHAWLGEQIEKKLGDGHAYGAHITYSVEGEQALETAGGIIQALPLLGDKPFILINGDIWSDYPVQQLPEEPEGLAHLVLVDNPSHHPEGDFVLTDHQLALNGQPRLTYSGIGVYRPALFAKLAPGVRPLAPILKDAIAAGQISAEHYQGQWLDIGTPQRLQQLDQQLRTQP